MRASAKMMQLRNNGRSSFGLMHVLNSVCTHAAACTLAEDSGLPEQYTSRSSPYPSSVDMRLAAVPALAADSGPFTTAPGALHLGGPGSNMRQELATMFAALPASTLAGHMLPPRPLSPCKEFLADHTLLEELLVEDSDREVGAGAPVKNATSPAVAADACMRAATDLQLSQAMRDPSDDENDEAGSGSGDAEWRPRRGSKSLDRSKRTTGSTAEERRRDRRCVLAAAAACWCCDDRVSKSAICDRSC